jgi:hypothetical protein
MRSLVRNKNGILDEKKMRSLARIKNRFKNSYKLALMQILTN